MTNKMMMASAAVIATLGSLAFAPSVYAHETQGLVTLEPGETDKPTGPIDTGDGSDVGGGETNQTGDLTIDNVTPLNFESVKLTGKGQKITYPHDNPNIQVTDKRGTGAGWKLMVKSSVFTDGTHTLKGASIDFPAGAVKTSKDDVDNNTAIPTANKINVAADDSSSDQMIMQANINQGLGSWVDLFEQNKDNAKVTLNIAGGAYVGKYTADLTWTLSDTPN